MKVVVTLQFESNAEFMQWAAEQAGVGIPLIAWTAPPKPAPITHNETERPSGEEPPF
jgi:hypothetical protein